MYLLNFSQGFQINQWSLVSLFLLTHYVLLRWNVLLYFNLKYLLFYVGKYCIIVLCNQMSFKLWCYLYYIIFFICNFIYLVLSFYQFFSIIIDLFFSHCQVTCYCQLVKIRQFIHMVMTLCLLRAWHLTVIKKYTNKYITKIRIFLYKGNAWQ